MAFTPNSKVYLLSGVPLNSDYSNTLTFSSASAQSSYFTGKISKSYEGVTYQRKDNSFRCPANVDDLWNCNYVMYQNTNFGTKWFYAFITKLDYVSQTCTEVHIETDVYQTWMFDITVKECFVVREHVSDDSVGKWLTEEDVDTGEFVHSSIVPSGHCSDLDIVIARATSKVGGQFDGGLYGGVYSGTQYLSVPATASGAGAVNDVIETLCSNGVGDSITTIFMCPSDFVTDVNTSAKSYTITPVTQPASLDGYTPHNNRLKSYPYMFLYVFTPAGTSATYRYEFMSGTSFTITGDMSPSPTVFLAPNNYKGVPTNWDEKLSLNNFPICNWTTNAFSNWLAQNKGTLGISLATDAVMLGTSLATDNTAGAVSGTTAIASQLANVYQRSIQPYQSKGSKGGGGSEIAAGIQDFFFMPTSITSQFAQRIDKYFDMFGYKVNTVKVPNITGRSNWNYVQTIDAKIQGNCPDEDLKRIIQMFNDGVTFWHNASNFGDYSLANT